MRAHSHTHTEEQHVLPTFWRRLSGSLRGRRQHSEATNCQATVACKINGHQSHNKWSNVFRPSLTRPRPPAHTPTRQDRKVVKFLVSKTACFTHSQNRFACGMRRQDQSVDCVRVARRGVGRVSCLRKDKDNSFCVCSAHMLATLVYSFELFPKAHLILIMRDNASYSMPCLPFVPPWPRSSSGSHICPGLLSSRSHLPCGLSNTQLAFSSTTQTSAVQQLDAQN